jgi:ribosomal protein S18 acetylase RimI-like enzyme
MYVAPPARRAGAGKALLAAAMAHARDRAGTLVLTLTVTQCNTAAIDLYRAAGFEAFGTEPMAILTPGGFRGKVHMWHHLHPLGTPA